MSTNITNDDKFKTVCNIKVEDVKKTDANTKGITKVAHSVMQYLQTTDEVDEKTEEKVHRFIEKVKKINEKFEKEDSEHEAPFTGSISALENLVQLRAHFTFKNMNDDKALDHLCKFLEKDLNTAIQKARTEEELEALEPFIKQCVALKKKVQHADKEGRLKSSFKHTSELYQLKEIQMKPVYTGLVSGQTIPNLHKSTQRKKVVERLTTFIEELSPLIGLIPKKDLSAIKDSLHSIQQEFIKEGDNRLDSILHTLTFAAALKKGARVEQPVVAKNEKKETIEKIQSDIADLKIGMKEGEFRTRIKSINDELKKLKSLDSTIDISAIEETLQMLVDPASLKISEEENYLVELFGNKYKISEQKVNAYQDSERTTVLDAQRTLLQKLQENAPQFETLNAACRKDNHRQKERVMQQRWNNFKEDNKSLPFAADFAGKFPILVNTFRSLRENIAEKELEEYWQKELNKFDQPLKGQFSKLLLNYSYLDPRKEVYPPLIKEVYRGFFTDLDFSKIDQMDNQTMSHYLQKMLPASKGIALRMIKPIYKSIDKVFQWLFDNFDRIKQPYNQLDQNDTNLSGKGVCLANCIHRYAQLIDDPKLPSQKVSMASTQKTRYQQSIGIHEPDFGIPEEKKMAAAFGLKYIFKKTILPVKDKNFEQHVVDMIEALEEERGITLAMLKFKHDEIGHSINVQFDTKNNIYRMMDDALGVVEFTDASEMKKELRSYFQTLYKGWGEYSITAFKKI